ncbi:MAG: VWA domain-containing protein [Thermomonas sp.]|uniref:vWA domain-containing protein n=1 Tax=Thermomonas sp. TaxID=1971895 RepID=UPI001EC21533|nr:VWA domain-containing protein [Thermomonas sp.]MBV2209619.1 VWA domain-containing protein [Thermomonas sp.]
MMQWWSAATSVDFAWPWLLIAAVLPWLWYHIIAGATPQQAALHVPWQKRLQQVAQGRSGFVRSRKFPWLLWLAWCLLCVAAARPQQLGAPIAPPRAGRELMLALDLSASMAEEDMQLGGQPVGRLTAAKAVLADFLQRRTGDKIGLLVFADRAFALTPLTLDHQSVRLQLHDAVLGLVGRATALGDAIALATKRLQGQGAKQKVLIVLTDGVNTAGVVEPEKAAQIAKDAGVRIYTVAFGGDGSALSVFGFRLPLGGGDDVDEAGLKRIAEMTGGQSFRARDTESLAKIYEEINRLEPVAQQGQMIRPKIERYPVPLGLALGLMLLALLLPRRNV